MDAKCPDKLLLAFKVLWSGWECDNFAEIREDPKGKRYLRQNNQTTDYRNGVKFLNGRITEYEKALKDTKKALALLTKKE